MKKFQYKTIQLSTSRKNNTELLNKEGEEGWELVCVHKGIAYLKLETIV